MSLERERMHPGGDHPLKDSCADSDGFVDAQESTTMLKDGFGTIERARRPFWSQPRCGGLSSFNGSVRPSLLPRNE
jgi:hypothetical protein